MRHQLPNDPAFPWVLNEDMRDEGMSMREWYAGQALVGILCNSSLPEMFVKGFAPKKAAEICFEIADAMLAESRK